MYSWEINNSVILNTLSSTLKVKFNHIWILNYWIRHQNVLSRDQRRWNSLHGTFLADPSQNVCSWWPGNSCPLIHRLLAGYNSCFLSSSISFLKSKAGIFWMYLRVGTFISLLVSQLNFHSNWVDIGGHETSTLQSTPHTLLYL